jgi:hypothetical protein
MKVLILGSSNDTQDWVEGGRKRHEIARDKLAVEFGEPVVVVVKNLWPNERVAEFVGRWMIESEPDVVYLNVTSYPFSYESLPLRLQRVLGRFGNGVGSASFQLADSRRWAHNAVFRTLRRWGQATLGGDTYFTPEQVVERMIETIRVIVRNEGTVLVVKGPHGRREPAITKREQRRHEAKRLYVHAALRAACAQSHVEYVGRATPDWQVTTRPKGVLIGDGLHSNAVGHAYRADGLFVTIRDAWTAHLTADELATSPHRDGESAAASGDVVN